MNDNQDHSTNKSAALVRLAKVMGPIRTEGLTENVVRQLKECICRRIITPGERLPPERELAALLKISRGSLRQVAHLTLSKAYSDRETGMELQVVSPRPVTERCSVKRTHHLPRYARE